MDATTLLTFLGLAVLAMVIAAQNWRYAFLMVLFLGFLQDPLRKITPGEPVALVMLSSVMVAVAVVVAMSRVGLITLRPLTQGNRMTQLVLMALIALVLAQSMMSFVRYKSLVVAGIGVIAYLSPIPAIWLAYRYLRGNADLARFIKIYVVLALILAGSLVLEKIGVESEIFGQVGEGIVIYDIDVGVLEAYGGFMRSPEVAAWHLGSAACLLVVFAIGRGKSVARFLVPALVVALLAVAMLTGRRKILAVVAAFAVLYLLALVYFRQRSGFRALLVSSLGGAVLAGAALFLAPEQNTVNPYLGRGATVFADASERFNTLGLGSISWAVQRAGPWGMGAGSVSQGTQHFGGADAATRGAAEGGLGKIIVELGVVGLILILLAVGLILRSIRRAVSVVAASGDRELLKANLGLLAFCAGNFPVFIGASQIYGDPFVLFILGSCMGFVLAGPRVLEQRRKVQATQDQVRASIGVVRSAVVPNT